MILAKNYISPNLFYANYQDSISDIIEIMHIKRVENIPLLDNDKFVGVIFKNDIKKLNIDLKINEIDKYLIKPYFVFGDEHIFEVIYQMSNYEMFVIPIIDKTQRLMGIITWKELIVHMNKLIAIDLPGGIIVLEIEKRNYSLKELSHIAEAENVKIINLNVINHPNKDDEILLTIKVNTLILEPILDSLKRYDYKVFSYFSQGEKLTEKMKDRYNLFMRYLEV